MAKEKVTKLVSASEDEAQTRSAAEDRAVGEGGKILETLASRDHAAGTSAAPRVGGL